MTMLSRDSKAFVRPAATWGTLGGLAQYTNDVILLCEACGYDIVLVESVGLGQSEVAVDDAVDMCMLLLPPATGDDLQGVKKGIMEVADLVVINKADGEFLTAARHAASSVRTALQLSRPKSKHWKTKVMRCSALTGEGVIEAWNAVREYRNVMSNTYTVEFSNQNELIRKRAKQSRKWMLRQFQFRVLKELESNEDISNLGEELEKELIVGHVTPRAAAAGKLFDEFLGGRR
jgi:LAO/AO transport system kinase